MAKDIPAYGKKIDKVKEQELSSSFNLAATVTCIFFPIVSFIALYRSTNLNVGFILAICCVILFVCYGMVLFLVKMFMKVFALENAENTAKAFNKMHQLSKDKEANQKMLYSMLHTASTITDDERKQCLVRNINLIKLESLKFFDKGDAHETKDLFMLNYRMREVLLNSSYTITAVYSEYYRYLNFYKDLDQREALKELKTRENQNKDNTESSEPNWCFPCKRKGAKNNLSRLETNPKVDTEEKFNTEEQTPKETPYGEYFAIRK